VTITAATFHHGLRFHFARVCGTLPKGIKTELDTTGPRNYPRQTFMSTAPVIHVQQLQKSYDKVEAVKGIDFQVAQG